MTDLPRWEALYEPGNVSDYLIGYLNDEAPAKAAAEAWMRSQMLDQPGTLRWDEFRLDGRFGCDVEYRLREIGEDGSETESGVLVQHRAAGQGYTVVPSDDLAEVIADLKGVLEQANANVEKTRAISQMLAEQSGETPR